MICILLLNVTAFFLPYIQQLTLYFYTHLTSGSGGKIIDDSACQSYFRCTNVSA